MRLYSGKIPVLSSDVVRALVENDHIEVVDEEEVRLDIEAVLKEYVRLDRQILDEAKARLDARGAGHAGLGKAKAQVAKERGAPPPDEPLPYILEQIMNMLFHSQNVEEIYGDDTQLRQVLTPILRRNMEVEDDLDQEIRSKIRNLQEGTATFDIEYAKVRDQIRRKRGLS
ncbi:MAG TPA: DUF507 family protein [Polyangiaceae bacterium LLY-WYZ-14_1]|nr:DUF507 family protein [Polyangiaceae bacterium LLY-WYZ-14_1]